MSGTALRANSYACGLASPAIDESSGFAFVLDAHGKTAHSNLEVR
jgi:hypothetical protein